MATATTPKPGAAAQELSELKATVKGLVDVIEPLTKAQPSAHGHTPDAVLNGKVHAEVKDVGEQDRWGWKSVGEQLVAIREAGRTQGRKLDKRFSAEHVAKFLPVEKAATGLGEVVSSDGGFLLAPTFVSEILKIMHEESGLMEQTRSFPISGPSIKIPAFDETSRATGSRRGGVRGYWVGEGDTITASKPKFKRLELSPHKLAVVVYLTDELIEDGGGMLEQMVPELAAEEINFLVGDSIFNGTGGGQPQGILSSPAKVAVAKETGQAAATIVTENIVKMYARLHRSCLKNARWYINQDTLPQLNTMTLGVGTGGQVVYMPPGALRDTPHVGGATGGVLYGLPVEITEYNATLGTEGDIILFDPTQYLTVRRDPIKELMSVHVEFLTDQLAYRFTFRVDGQNWWTSALTPFKGTATQSNIVTLATRS